MQLSLTPPARWTLQGNPNCAVLLGKLPGSTGQVRLPCKGHCAVSMQLSLTPTRLSMRQSLSLRAAPLFYIALSLCLCTISLFVRVCASLCVPM